MTQNETPQRRSIERRHILINWAALVRKVKEQLRLVGAAWLIPQAVLGRWYGLVLTTQQQLILTARLAILRFVSVRRLTQETA